MPIYEYKCDKCSAVFEVMQRFSDQPLAIHEGCGGAVERLISTSALQFKGSGWYVTDYARNKGGANGETKKSSETKSDTKKSESKTESTPAAKPDK